MIQAALLECRLRKQFQKEKNPSHRERGAAISFRFVKDSKSWKPFVSPQEPEVKTVTRPECGIVGVDINVNHLAVVEADRHGNPIQKVSLPCCVYGKSSHQAKAVFGEVAKRIVARAAEAKKPIALEKLDFCDKKRFLRDSSTKQARMLPSFAYRQLLEAMDDTLNILNLPKAHPETYAFI